jgi:tRNA/rRNA methyltransferase
MAGTNSRQIKDAPPGPAVVLVRPQLGENIGMTARAMLNCGLTDLRLVAPKLGWPNPHAVAAAAGADRVLDAARVFPTTREAIADLERVYATTARARGLVKEVMTPRAAAATLHAEIDAGLGCGLLFGPERTGLENDEVALADALITVPLNPGYSSLNLAQGVLLVAYEWWIAGDGTPDRQLEYGDSPPADKTTLFGFLDRLDELLDRLGFYYPPEKRPGMRRNVHALFQRARPSEQEVRTLHGILSALLGAKLKRGPEALAERARAEVGDVGERDG